MSSSNSNHGNGTPQTSPGGSIHTPEGRDEARVNDGPGGLLETKMDNVCNKMDNVCTKLDNVAENINSLVDVIKEMVAEMRINRP